jgi:Flp pilus assembly protein CpaB
MKSSLAVLAIGALAAIATPTPEGKPTLDVPPKARAFSLETALVGGGVIPRPGDHVDVLSVMQEPETKKLVGVTLLQNVIVIANAPPAPGDPRQLSLLLIPEEAQLLALAKEGGKLSVTLRNPVDPDLLDSVDLATISSTLLGKLVPPPKRK